jgi:hypothetical protein
MATKSQPKEKPTFKTIDEVNQFIHQELDRLFYSRDIDERIEDLNNCIHLYTLPVSEWIDYVQHTDDMVMTIRMIHEVESVLMKLNRARIELHRLADAAAMSKENISVAS